MLSIPFDLCASVAPVGQSESGGTHADDAVTMILRSHTKVPASYGPVNAGCRHQIRISGMPIDISDRSVMSVNRAIEGSRCRGGGQIPHEQALRGGRQNEV